MFFVCLFISVNAVHWHWLGANFVCPVLFFDESQKNIDCMSFSVIHFNALNFELKIHTTFFFISSFLHRFQFVDDTPWRIHCSKLLYTFFVVVVIFLIDRLWCNVMFKLNIYVEILFCGIYLVAFFCFCFCCCCCNGYLVKLLIDTVLWGGGWQTRNKIVMWRHI